MYAARPAQGWERLRDGQIIVAGEAGLTAVATPGHTPDHVA